MPVPHETITFDVHDAKVYKLTADSGSSPTYDAAVDVPGIADISIDPNLVTAELKGDAKVIAKRGRTDRVSASLTYGKLSLDVLEVILAGTVSDGSPGANDASYELLGDNSLPSFKLEVRISDTSLDMEDVHLVLWKCQLTGGTLVSPSTDNFGQPTMEVEAIPAESNDKLVTIKFLEAATALSA